MPTSVSIQYVDKLQSWYESASTLQGYVWAVLNGEDIAGSSTVPIAAIPPQTGALAEDIRDFVLAALEEITGDLPIVYNYPGAIATPGYGADFKDYGNQIHNRPLVALAYDDAYTFGLLNIPAREETDVLQFVIKMEGYPSSNSEVSPAYEELQQYIDNNDGKLPILMVMELNPE